MGNDHLSACPACGFAVFSCKYLLAQERRLALGGCCPFYWNCSFLFPWPRVCLLSFLLIPVSPGEKWLQCIGGVEICVALCAAFCPDVALYGKTRSIGGAL